MLIYKICPASLWRDAVRDGVFKGAAIDLTDGFIHFSTAEQVAETAAKHFAGQEDLLLIAVEADRLGERLKWEPSRGGALFPHLYGDLPLTEVEQVDELPIGANGAHVFPPRRARGAAQPCSAEPARDCRVEGPVPASNPAITRFSQ